MLKWLEFEQHSKTHPGDSRASNTNTVNILCGSKTNSTQRKPTIIVERC